MLCLRPTSCYRILLEPSYLFPDAFVSLHLLSAIGTMLPQQDDSATFITTDQPPAHGLSYPCNNGRDCQKLQQLSFCPSELGQTMVPDERDTLRQQNLESSLNYVRICQQLLEIQKPQPGMDAQVPPERILRLPILKAPTQYIKDSWVLCKNVTNCGQLVRVSQGLSNPPTYCASCYGHNTQVAHTSGIQPKQPHISAWLCRDTGMTLHSNLPTSDSKRYSSPDGRNRQPYEESCTPRPRWCPTPEQIQLLESIYNSGTTTPSRDMIVDIAAQLRSFGNIAEANVFYWFQNRKARAKRKLQILVAEDGGSRTEKEPRTRCKRGSQTTSSGSSSISEAPQKSNYSLHDVLAADDGPRDKLGLLQTKASVITEPSNSQSASDGELMIVNDQQPLQEDSQITRMHEDLLANQLLLQQLLQQSSILQEGRTALHAGLQPSPGTINLQQLMLNPRTSLSLALPVQRFLQHNTAERNELGVGSEVNQGPLASLLASNADSFSTLQELEQILQHNNLPAEPNSGQDALQDMSSGDILPPVRAGYPQSFVKANCTNQPIVATEKLIGASSGIGDRSEAQLWEDLEQCASWDVVTKQSNLFV